MEVLLLRARVWQNSCRTIAIAFVQPTAGWLFSGFIYSKRCATFVYRFQSG
jgi:hypothetical protein